MNQNNKEPQEQKNSIYNSHQTQPLNSERKLFSQ